MSEIIRDGRFVELTYKVTDRKSGHVLTRVEFPLGYVHGRNEILAPSVHRQLEGKSAGDVIEVAAVAVGTWGNGEPGGYIVDWVDLVVPECGKTEDGRFTGGGSQVRVGDVRVTRGLTIHCDLLLSNNLEVNWGGKQFHMTEHLTTVACTDDPNIIQAPPVAPLDTLIGVGTGRYNGANGYTIEFTLQDFGEPGSSDRMAIKIYQTANPANVVLNVPLQVLSGGNLQAHFDQPHKNDQ